MKRSIILVQLGLVACLGLTTPGCVGEDPLADRDYVKDDDCDDDGKCDDDDDDESSREKMAAPLVDDLEKGTACEKVIPVRGKTKPNTMVFVKGGKGDSLERSDEDGTFCVPVTLNEGDNTLVVYAHDKYGNESQPSEELEVTQEGDCSDDYEETPEDDEPEIGDVTRQAFNVKKIDDQVVPGGDIGKQQGDFEDLFDGRVSTGVRLSTDKYSFDNPIWVHFKLNEPQVADGAEVIVEFSEKEENGGEAYAKEYFVLWSADDSPGDPQPSATARWSQVGWKTKGEGGPDRFTISAESNKKIRHLALYLKDSDTLWTENYAIGELRLRARQYAPARSSKPESRVCD